MAQDARDGSWWIKTRTGIAPEKQDKLNQKQNRNPFVVIVQDHHAFCDIDPIPNCLRYIKHSVCVIVAYKFFPEKETNVKVMRVEPEATTITLVQVEQGVVQILEAIYVPRKDSDYDIKVTRACEKLKAQEVFWTGTDSAEILRLGGTLRIPPAEAAIRGALIQCETAYFASRQSERMV